MRDNLRQFRQQIDDFMRQHPQSPLDGAARRQFKGLNYYAPDAAYVFEGKVVLSAEAGLPVPMQTSTGDTVLFRRWGVFGFKVEGVAAELTIYSDEDGHGLFLPFKDATNGSETYGAGRYLDNHRPGLWQLSSTRLRLDFNFAYNPYCAYSPYYSCPLPPTENWLTVAIRAGEKSPSAS